MSLSPKQVAEELTRQVCISRNTGVCTLSISLTPPILCATPLQDSEVFCSIDASEYISDLWRDPDHLTKENLSKFENVSVG